VAALGRRDGVRAGCIGIGARHGHRRAAIGPAIERLGAVFGCAGIGARLGRRRRASPFSAVRASARGSAVGAAQARFRLASDSPNESMVRQAPTSRSVAHGFLQIRLPGVNDGNRGDSPSDTSSSRGLTETAAVSYTNPEERSPVRHPGPVVWTSPPVAPRAARAARRCSLGRRRVVCDASARAAVAPRAARRRSSVRGTILRLSGCSGQDRPQMQGSSPDELESGNRARDLASITLFDGP
jgi:hypothetical protein